MGSMLPPLVVPQTRNPDLPDGIGVALERVS